MQILKKNFKSLLIVIISVGGFAFLRLFQEKIFYDPFITFFKSDYHEQPYPDLQVSKFYLNIILRYIVNSLLSLLVIFAIFKTAEILKFISILYVFFGIILMLFLIWELHFSSDKSTFFLFYTRRFLIQPLFLLLFIPALFFQRKSQA